MNHKDVRYKHMLLEYYMFSIFHVFSKPPDKKDELSMY